MTTAIRIGIVIVTFFGMSVRHGLAQLQIDTVHIKCHGGENGRATLQISTAPGPYKIKWFKGSEHLAKFDDKMSANSLGPGQYRVEVKDKNDCMIERPFVIKEPPKLSLSITSSTGAYDYCGSKSFPDVTLFGESSGGTAPRSCSASSCLQRVSGPGEYSFTVTDANGCKETKSVRVNWVGLFCSSDPNDITGPAGFDVPRWVKASDPMEYTIRFENDPEFATAPAQHVFIEHVFDPRVNPFSLRLGNFGFGAFNFSLPFTSTFHQQRLDLQNEIGLYVDVVAGVDVVNNRAFWSFQSIDPVTGQPPIDPLNGFLPVNDSLVGNGEGFVTFTLTPKPSAQTGDVVSASAGIAFDINEVIHTNTWTNTLDKLPPVSQMHPLPAESEDTEITLSWSAQDDNGGCGIRDYAIFYRINDGPVLPLGSGITDTFLVFNGLPANTYGFFVVATDHVGNTEIKTAVEQTVTILAQEYVEIQSPLSGPKCSWDTLEIRWVSTRIDSLRLLITFDSGVHYSVIAPWLSSLDTITSVVLNDTMVTNHARVRFESLESGAQQFHSAWFSIKPLPDVIATGDGPVCEAKAANLFASGANNYIWSPGGTLNDSTSAFPTAYPGALTTTYYVTGTDVFGCRNTDSVTVAVLLNGRDTATVQICAGDSAYINGMWRFTSGYFTQTHTGSNGCDSLYVTQLIVHDPCNWAGGDIVFVDHTATGNNDGTSWEHAFNKLEDALFISNLFDDVVEIWIAEGVYYPTAGFDRALSFVFKDSTRLYGGFQGVETERSQRNTAEYPVVLSGDVGVSAANDDNALHVVMIDQTCIDCTLDGVTISFGNADGTDPDDRGAGVYSQGTATLRNVIVEHNTAVLGAAVTHTGIGSELVIEDCILRLNTSSLSHDILNVQGALLIFRGNNVIQE